MTASRQTVQWVLLEKGSQGSRFGGPLKRPQDTEVVDQDIHTRHVPFERSSCSLRQIQIIRLGCTAHFVVAHGTAGEVLHPRWAQHTPRIPPAALLMSQGKAIAYTLRV